VHAVAEIHLMPGIDTNALDSWPDAQLAAASRRGDREAYATLARRHTRIVFAVCYGILSDVSDAEDAVQEVCLKAMTKLDDLHDGERFGAWISQIARNHCRDLLRARKRHREILTQRSAELKRPEPGDFSELHAALEKLSEDYRLPLMLYYFDGQSTKSVAEALDLSQGGACTRLCRARKELRRLLERQGGRR